jgi:N-acetylglucosaminyl-diphospho-decaprenol L-rhamnosyltransferase
MPAAHNRATGSPTKVDVVIVTARGSWELVDDCLRSLRAHPPANAILSVRVVDNNSADGTVERLRHAYPGVTVDDLETNRGFAYGSNYGIRRTEAPYVLLLNPDTVVQDRSLEPLIAALDEHPLAAVVGPRLVGLDGTPDHNAKRTFPTPTAAMRHFLGIDRRSGGYGYSAISESGAGRVDAVSGSCMLVRRSAITEVGVLDEGYFMYGEDLDWCRRFGQAGWEVRYVGSATVVHVKHGVTGRYRTLRTNWAFHRSMGRFYRRFDSGGRLWLDAAVYGGVLLKFLASATHSSVARALTGRSPGS